VGTVVIEVRRSGDFDPDFPSSQKAAPAFDVDDVTGHDWNSARSQFKKLASRFIHYRNHPNLRPACRANKDIQADVCDYS
jgi:hypothetical protein